MRVATKRVRLQDVAERAGVSVGGASRAFRAAGLVSAEVRERVLVAAKELGYAGPDPAARRLRLGARALGLIFRDGSLPARDTAALARQSGSRRAWRLELGLLLIRTRPTAPRPSRQRSAMLPSTGS